MVMLMLQVLLRMRGRLGRSEACRDLGMILMSAVYVFSG
jgi:hypothetical protein